MGLAAILDVVLPPACAACGLPGGPACAACRAALRDLPPPLCDGCGGPVPVPVARCPACRGPLGWGRQSVEWAGPAPALVLALKEGRRRTLAGVLAGEVAQRVPPPPEGWVLVPVPLARGRERARGFNQSALLAGALGRRWGLPVADCLRRVRDGPPQRGASATVRERQAAAAYAPGGRDPVPARAVLVDDVRTTGATLAACARSLRRGGAEEVGAVCFARVV
ncbi:MAG: ComF family protein [Thermoleophilia bacterium]